MCPWCSGGQQRNASGIESYTNSGPSGVRLGTEISLGDDQARDTATNCEAPDNMRVPPPRAVECRDPGANQRAGRGTERKPGRFVPIVVVALNQKAIAGHHSDDSSNRGHCSKL